MFAFVALSIAQRYEICYIYPYAFELSELITETKYAVSAIMNVLL